MRAVFQLPQVDIGNNSTAFFTHSFKEDQLEAFDGREKPDDDDLTPAKLQKPQKPPKEFAFMGRPDGEVKIVKDWSSRQPMCFDAFRIRQLSADVGFVTNVLAGAF